MLKTAVFTMFPPVIAIVLLMLLAWPAVTAQEAQTTGTITLTPAELKAATIQPVNFKSTPTLTEVERLQFLLQFRTLLLRIENDQLKMQVIKDDHDKARAELTTLLQSRQVPDHTFDTETATYQPELKKEPLHPVPPGKP